MSPVAIEALDDPRVAPYRDLREGRLFEEQGCFVAESRHVVRRLLASGRFPVRSLFVTPAALADLTGELATLAAPPPVLLADHALLCEVAGYHVHQGCLALAERGAEPALAELARRAAGARPPCGLEALTDPANVGSLFRTARFRRRRVSLAPGCAPACPSRCALSMAHFWSVPFATAALARRARQAAGRGLLVLGASPSRGRRSARSRDASPAALARVLLFGTDAQASRRPRAPGGLRDHGAAAPASTRSTSPRSRASVATLRRAVRGEGADRGAGYLGAALPAAGRGGHEVLCCGGSADSAALRARVSRGPSAPRALDALPAADWFLLHRRCGRAQRRRVSARVLEGLAAVARFGRARPAAARFTRAGVLRQRAAIGCTKRDAEPADFREPSARG